MSGKAGQAPPASVFVEMWRGTVVVDAEGVEVPLEKGSYVVKSVQEMEAAAPVGTRVIVAGMKISSTVEFDEYDCKVVSHWQPLANTEWLLAPVPQSR